MDKDKITQAIKAIQDIDIEKTPNDDIDKLTVLTALRQITAEVSGRGEDPVPLDIFDSMNDESRSWCLLGLVTLVGKAVTSE